MALGPGKPRPGTRHSRLQEQRTCTDREHDTCTAKLDGLQYTREGCTFHVYMPYRKGGVVKVRAVSEETKAKLREARLRKGAKIKSVVVG